MSLTDEERAAVKERLAKTDWLALTPEQRTVVAQIFSGTDDDDDVR